MIAENGVENASGFSKQSRTVRFGIIQRCLREFTGLDTKLLDYGCNDGELAFQLSINPHRWTYTGIDINPKVIKWARKRFSHESLKFMVGNILVDETFAKLQRMKPDVVVASGVLSYAGDAHAYHELLYRLFTIAQKGVIFSVLSADCPKKLCVPTKGMIRWQPAQLLRLVQACGCNSWEMLRSYLHNDITVVMRKKWTHYVPK